MKIKKILKTAASLLISAALLTGTIPAVSASAADYYIKATTSQTNVRKGPGTEYKAIGKIKCLPNLAAAQNVLQKICDSNNVPDFIIDIIRNYEDA